MQTQQTFASGTQVTLSARFPAMAARIDNLSNQWYVITGMPGGWCPPYTAGLIIALAGAGSVSMTPQAPPSANQLAPIAGEQITITLSSDAQPASPGMGLPGSGVPTSILTLKFNVSAFVLLSTIFTVNRLASLLIKADTLNTVDVAISMGPNGVSSFWFHLAAGESTALSFLDPRTLAIGSVDGSAQSVHTLAVY